MFSLGVQHTERMEMPWSPPPARSEVHQLFENPEQAPEQNLWRGPVREAVRGAFTVPEFCDDDDFATLSAELARHPSPEKMMVIFADYYPSGVRGHAFHTLHEMPDGHVVAIDQHGQLRIFENRAALAYTRTLNEISADNPFIPDWECPDTSALDQRRAVFQGQLAHDFDVPLAQRDAWIHANLDEMTGLMNRSILRVVEDFILAGKQFSVASFDADHFGALNKLKGMEYGDHLIAIMGDEFQTLKENLHKKGFEIQVGRMGGEEFLPVTTAPKDILYAEMRDLNMRVQARIQETLTPEQQVILQDILYDTKGIDHGISAREIGSSTAAVVDFDFKAVSAVDATEVARAVAHMADGLLESAKNNPRRFNPDAVSGRNAQYLEAHDSHSNVERLIGRTEKPKVDLSAAQHTNLEAFAEEILAKKEATRMAEMPAYCTLDETMKQSGLTVREQRLVHHVVSSPVGRASLAAPLRAEIDAALARHADLPRQLDAARDDFIRFAADHEPSLNTLSPRAYRETAELPQFRGGAELVVDPLQFKAINEVLGHGFADRLLEQNVLDTRAVLAARGIDAAVSKDLSKLRIRLPASLHATDVAEIQEAIATRYEQAFCDLVGASGLPGRLDQGNDGAPPLYTLLGAWQQKNQTREKMSAEPLGTAAVHLRAAA